MLKKLSIISFILLVSTVAFAQNKSVYSSLDTEKCKATKNSSDDGYEGICKGVGGFNLELSEGDLRQNIKVISPTKKMFDLNLWQIYSGFSAVGDKAEWRMKGAVPTALIVRFNVSENPEDSTVITSYLIVSKVSKTSACVVDVVKPSKTQNADAQKIADKASTMACRKSE
jgi:hypothetical protein